MILLAILTPPHADATVAPPVVTGKTVTITADAGNDSITLSVIAGVIAVNGNATSVAAAPDTTIVVDSGGGSDLIDASELSPADYGSMLADAGTAADNILGGDNRDEIHGESGGDLLDGGDGADALFGGAGADTLAGKLGADRISGGDDEDVLFGQQDDDLMAGDRGSDKVFGSDGDDTIVWSDGDGSDIVSGSEGYDRLDINGSPTGGDAFRLVNGGGLTQFTRSNLEPFTIDLVDPSTLLVADAAGPEPNGGFEAVEVSAGAGDDSFSVAPSLSGLDVRADGGSGNDTLTGSEEHDQFLGGSGNDVIDPGSGTDLADGGDGDDRLFTRDGSTDLVRGGEGSDIATTDSIVVDSVDEVESLDATPLTPKPDTEAGLPTIGKLKVTRKSGRLFARVPFALPGRRTQRVPNRPDHRDDQSRTDGSVSGIPDPRLRSHAADRRRGYDAEGPAGEQHQPPERPAAAEGSGSPEHVRFRGKFELHGPDREVAYSAVGVAFDVDAIGRELGPRP